MSRLHVVAHRAARLWPTWVYDVRPAGWGPRVRCPLAESRPWLVRPRFARSQASMKASWRRRDSSCASMHSTRSPPRPDRRFHCRAPPAPPLPHTTPMPKLGVTIHTPMFGMRGGASKRFYHSLLPVKRSAGLPGRCPLHLLPPYQPTPILRPYVWLVGCDRGQPEVAIEAS